VEKVRKEEEIKVKIDIVWLREAKMLSGKKA